MLRSFFSFLLFTLLATGESFVVAVLWIEEEEPISHHPVVVSPAVYEWQRRLVEPVACELTFATRAVLRPGADSAVMTLKLPPTIDGLQSFELAEPTDSRIVTFRNGDDVYAQALVSADQPDVTITLRGRLARTHTYGQARMLAAYGIAPRRPVRPSSIESRWYEQERWTGEKVRLIENMASATDATEAGEVARWAFGVCRQRLHYQRNGVFIDLDEALRTGRGDCTEFSDLFIALCRARGVAARACMGWSADRDGTMGAHQWAEVLDPNFGWITVDPTYADYPDTSCEVVLQPLVFITYDRGHWLLRDRPLIAWFNIEGRATGQMTASIKVDGFTTP